MKTKHPSSPKISRGLATIALGLGFLAGAPLASAGTINIDAGKQTAGNPHFWSASFGTGTAALSLRGDLQTHYKIGARELGAQRVRGHGLLNDAMGLYKGSGSYDWKNLDIYLTGITSAGMRPIIELDFMPTALASKDDKSPPKSYDDWKNFIKALTQHLIDKYGADDVAKWYFEVWNEPNYPGFWNNSDMSAYYTLYDNTVDALTSVIPNVLVGGPATTDPSPIPAFLSHCKSANKRLTFVSSHCYPGGGATGTSADPNSLVNDNNTRISQITGAGYKTSDVRSFNTEWNSSYSGQGSQQGDATNSMDNHWNVGFIIKASKLLADKDSGDTPPLDVFSYWVLSDVFDEAGGPSGSYMLGHLGQPFGQVFGVMTVQGIRKAAFNAFKLLNMTGPKRLMVSGGNDNSGGINAMATTSDSGDSLQILLYNYNNTLNTASGSGDSQAISVTGLPSALSGKEIFVTTYVVDENNSNPYSVWKSKTSSCTSCSEDQWRQIKAAQHLAVTSTKKTVDTTFSTTVTMLKQSATLVILSTKRPLMGRDAFTPIEAEDYDGQSSGKAQDSGDTTLDQSMVVSANGYLYFEKVDYSDDGASSVDFRYKAGSDATIELRQDSDTGTSLGKCTLAAASSWTTQNCKLSQAVTGVSKLYLMFGGAAEVNWLKFQGSSNPGSGGSGAGGSAAGGSSGSPNSGGASGSAAGGSTGRGGAAGNGAGGAAGSGNGGATGSGSGGTNSSGNGGATSGGGGDSGGSAGNGNGGSGSGGVSGTGGSSQGGTSGCACRIGDPRGPSGALVLIGFVAAALGLRRGKVRRRAPRH